MPQSSQTAAGLTARIVIDQSKIRIDENLVARGAPAFPRTLAWWRRNVPLWMNVATDSQGLIVLEPNGKHPDGSVIEVTPAVRRRRLQAARQWIDNQIYLDFSDAVAADPEGGVR